MMCFCKLNKVALKLVLTDAFLLFSPLLILLYVMFLNGVDMQRWLTAPEWSFVSLFFLIEVLRDDVCMEVRRQISAKEISAGVTFWAVLLVVAALILAMDFQQSVGNPESPSTVDFVKWFWFAFCFIVFFLKRYKKHCAKE